MIGIGFALRGSPIVRSGSSHELDGQPPAVLMSVATARFFVLDWWLVPACRLDGWEPMVVLDVGRALDHLGDWWLGPAYRLDFRSPAVVLDVVGDRTYLQGA
jgi:hypothetical protein